MNEWMHELLKTAIWIWQESTFLKVVQSIYCRVFYWNWNGWNHFSIHYELNLHHITSQKLQYQCFWTIKVCVTFEKQLHDHFSVKAYRDPPIAYMQVTTVFLTKNHIPSRMNTVTNHVNSFLSQMSVYCICIDVREQIVNRTIEVLLIACSGVVHNLRINPCPIDEIRNTETEMCVLIDVLWD